MGRRTNTAKWIENSKRWQINVQKDGKRKSFYSSAPGRTGQRECNAKADAWLDENITSANLKISVLFDDYMKELEVTASQSNIKKTYSIGKNWILPYLGNIKISHLTEQHIQDMVNKAFQKGLAKKSLMNIRGITHTFLRYCRKRKATNLFPENVIIPQRAISKPKQILQPDKMQILFTSEKTLLYNKEVTDPYINAYRLQVLCGLRPGELMALKWKNIKDGIVVIDSSKNYLNEFTTGKNDNAKRRFALSAIAEAVLNAQKELTGNDEFVFGEMSLSRYEKYWRRYCDYNDIGSITLYELRHTFVSIAKNLPEGVIKTIVGHSRNMDTFGVYGHEIAGELNNTAKQLNTFFEDIFTNKQV